MPRKDKDYILLIEADPSSSPSAMPAGGPGMDPLEEKRVTATRTLRTTLDTSNNAELEQLGESVITELRELERKPKNIAYAIIIMDETNSLIKLADNLRSSNRETVLQAIEGYKQLVDKAPGKSFPSLLPTAERLILITPALILLGGALALATTIIRFIISEISGKTPSIEGVVFAGLGLMGLGVGTAVFGTACCYLGQREGIREKMHDIVVYSSLISEFCSLDTTLETTRDTQLQQQGSNLMKELKELKYKARDKARFFAYAINVVSDTNQLIQLADNPYSTPGKILTATQAYKQLAKQTPCDHLLEFFGEKDNNTTSWRNVVTTMSNVAEAAINTKKRNA